MKKIRKYVHKKISDASLNLYNKTQESKNKYIKFIAEKPWKYAIGSFVPGEKQIEKEKKYDMNSLSPTKFSVSIDTIVNAAQFLLGTYLITKSPEFQISDLTGSGFGLNSLRGLGFCSWRWYDLLKNNRRSAAFYIEIPYRTGKTLMQHLLQHDSDWENAFKSYELNHSNL